MLTLLRPPHPTRHLSLISDRSRSLRRPHPARLIPPPPQSHPWHHFRWTPTEDSPTTPSNSHRRRRSTVSDIGERRPKKGDEDYIKRPENAFILFRRKCCEDRNLAQGAGEAGEGDGSAPKKQRQADLSKTISQQWKSLSAEERQYWEDLAKEKKVCTPFANLRFPYFLCSLP